MNKNAADLSMLKAVLKLLVGGGVVGGTAGGIHGGVTETNPGESRMGRVFKHMGIGALGGAPLGAAGAIGGSAAGLYGGAARLSRISRRPTPEALAERLAPVVRNTLQGAGAGLAVGGTLGGLGASALSDKYGSVYTQGFIDKCAAYGLDPEKVAGAYVPENDVPVVSKEERAADAAWRVKAEAEQKKNPPPAEKAIPDSIVPKPTPAPVKK